MSRIEDGGPAFPQSDWSFQGGDGREGMSLRDWFAGQAIMGFFASTERPTTMAIDDAEWAYRIADALLSARAPREEGRG